MNGNGMSFFDSDFNLKLKIGWRYFDEIVASKNSCVIILNNFPHKFNNNFYDYPVEDDLDEMLFREQNPFKHEIKLNFETNSQLMSFFDDFTQNHYFYNPSDEACVEKPTKFVSKRLQLLRKLHIKTGDTSHIKFFTLKSPNFLIDPPLKYLKSTLDSSNNDKIFDLNSIDNFGDLFEEVIDNSILSKNLSEPISESERITDQITNDHNKILTSSGIKDNLPKLPSSILTDFSKTADPIVTDSSNPIKGQSISEEKTKDIEFCIFNSVIN